MVQSTPRHRIRPARRDTSPSPSSRSRLTNGALFLNGDGRVASARRFRDLVAEYERALPSRGINEIQRQLVKRAAMLSVLGEQAEDNLASGEPVDPAAIVKLTGSLRRVLHSLGIPTRPRRPQSQMTLEEYVAGPGGRGEPIDADLETLTDLRDVDDDDDEEE